jgi:hypothetical protein
MNIVKQSTGNVVLTDNSGNIVKVFVMVNALDVVSSNEIIIKYGMNQWTTLFADQIDNTQIEPAAAVPFSGNAYALVTLLSNSFFFELSGGGGSQNLSQVLTVGNSANNQDILDVDKLDFNLATTDTAGVGQLVWNNTDGTLDLGLQTGLLNKIGQQVVVKARNLSGSTITKGSIVKVVAVSGGFIGINLALGDSDANSGTAFGIVAQDIADSANGFVAIHGIVHGLNTNAFTEGDVLYLSPTVAGTFTNVKPVAPEHAVVIGYVAKKNATDGHILLHVQNGYELNELHDVAYPTVLANNEILSYNSSNLRWENKTIASTLGFTPAQSEGWDVIVKSASQNVNNATLTDDTELQFSVVAGGSYMIQMVLATASDSNLNDYKFGFAVSAGTMTGVGNAVCRNAVNSGTVTVISATAANVTNSVVIGQNTGTIPSSSGIVTATIDYGFYATTNGVFKFQFALNTGATTARTFKGTILKYKRLD